MKHAMITRLNIGTIGCALICAAVSTAAADENNKTAGIPPAVTLDQFKDLFEKSPFRRHLSLSESLILSGVANLPTGDVVTVLNRASSETFVVSKSPNAQGWKLLELSNHNDLTKVSAKITAGGHVVTLRFDPQRLAPEVIKTSAKPGIKTVESTRWSRPSSRTSISKAPPHSNSSSLSSRSSFARRSPGS